MGLDSVRPFSLNGTDLVEWSKVENLGLRKSTIAIACAAHAMHFGGTSRRAHTRIGCATSQPRMSNQTDDLFTLGAGGRGIRREDRTVLRSGATQTHSGCFSTRTARPLR